MSYIGQNLNVANSTPRASETQVGLTPYATTAETLLGSEAGKAVTPVGVMAALNSYGVTQADQRQATAWVNFNGIGTVAIRGAYNVSSITDNGTGNYTINFTTPMNNANYAAVGMNSHDAALARSNGRNANSFSIFFDNVGGVAGIDSDDVNVIVFGGK